MWPIRVVAILCSVLITACEPGTGPGDGDGSEGDLDLEYRSSLDGLDELDGYDGELDMPLTHGGPLMSGGKHRPAASMSSFHLAERRLGTEPVVLLAGIPGFGNDIMCGWSGP